MNAFLMRLGLAGLLVLGATVVNAATSTTTTTTTTARSTSTAGTTTAGTTATVRTTSTTAAGTTATVRTTTTTAAATTSTTNAPQAVARTGGASTIKVVFPTAATPATDSEKAMARESAYRLAHWATYGFRFYLVHRAENEFTNLYVDSVTDDLYWHADFLSEDNRYRYTYGSDSMYLTGVSHVGAQATMRSATPAAATTTTAATGTGTAATTTTAAPAPAATSTTTGDPGDPITGVTVSDVTEENIGGVNMAVATVDPANFNYTTWQDYYLDKDGKVQTPEQVKAARDAAVAANTNAPLFYFMRNPWHLNYTRRMDTESQTVSVTADLGRDTVHHLVAKAIISYYKQKVAQHEMLNFVAQAYVSGISGYTVTDNGPNKPKTVTASVTLLLPKAIYMEQGGLYEQWRHNFFNIRDYSGIERGANDYYGQSFYARSGMYRSNGGDYTRRRAFAPPPVTVTTSTTTAAATTN
jgi:hypothetical protein